jgi:hypothetical protein
MSDLVITATSVLPGGSAVIARGNAGAAVTAGQVVYLDTAAGTYKLADCDSATAAARSPSGIALHGAASGQPLAVLTSGNITIGATVTAGVAYYLSGTAGGICPVADLATGDYPTLIGFATSASVVRVSLVESGVALA